MNPSLHEEIQQRLQALAPSYLALVDESAQHAGHAGNGGGGHFFVTVKSSLFSGKSLIMRHRMVYQLLQDLMPHRIHALRIEALIDDESSMNTQ